MFGLFKIVWLIPGPVVVCSVLQTLQCLPHPDAYEGTKVETVRSEQLVHTACRWLLYGCEASSIAILGLFISGRDSLASSLFT